MAKQNKLVCCNKVKKRIGKICSKRNNEINFQKLSVVLKKFCTTLMVKMLGYSFHQLASVRRAYLTPPTNSISVKLDSHESCFKYLNRVDDAYH